MHMTYVYSFTREHFFKFSLINDINVVSKMVNPYITLSVCNTKPL